MVTISKTLAKHKNEEILIKKIRPLWNVAGD